jgi:biotin operon repressor
LTEDLARATDAGRAAIEPMIQRLEADGVPAAWLKRCDAEARDGTRLPGCVKLYIPQPAGQWGAVLLGGCGE